MPAHGEPVTQLKPVNYVSDFAHALDANTESQLNALCREIDERAHAQIAVVTINTLDGRDVEGYAVDLFKQWGVGSKATNRGVLILYAMQDHKSRIEVGYGLEPILPDGKVGGFMREAAPLMRNGNYSGALTLVTRRVADVIAADAGVQLANVPSPAAPPERTEPSGKFPGALLFILLILVLFTPLRRVLFWMLIGNVLGGGYGGRRGGFGGGGFGGFGGGGGGFGGFGGGMSGGGGASGGW
jgi:uncharacterized protein